MEKEEFKAVLEKLLSSEEINHIKDFLEEDDPSKDEKLSEMMKEELLILNKPDLNVDVDVDKMWKDEEYKKKFKELMEKLLEKNGGGRKQRGGAWPEWAIWWDLIIAFQIIRGHVSMHEDIFRGTPIALFRAFERQEQHRLRAQENFYNNRYGDLNDVIQLFAIGSAFFFYIGCPFTGTLLLLKLYVVLRTFDRETQGMLSHLLFLGGRKKRRKKNRKKRTKKKARRRRRRKSKRRRQR